MSTANPTSPDGPFDPSHGPHHRRSREEMEALAKNFVAAPVEKAPAPAKPFAKIAMAAGGVALLAVLVVVAWPAREEAARPAPAEANRAAAEVEELRQRLEAERERKRQDLAAGKEYLERIAAADASLVDEMTERAQRLSERAAAAPATATDDVPTPRDEPAPTAPAPKAPATSLAAAAPAAPAPAKTAPAPEQQVAKAAPAEAVKCALHVSELSKSGKLTYADVARMKGARLDEKTGNVTTPPVQSIGKRPVAFEVQPNGCARLVRQ